MHLRLSRVHNMPNLPSPRGPPGKLRFPLSPAMTLLLAPLIYSTIRAVQHDTTVTNASHTWTDGPAVQRHHAPSLHAEGVRMPFHDNISVQSKNEPPTIPTLKKHMRNSTDPAFVPGDLSNTTKMFVTFNGFPPKSLPVSHPHAQILKSIRAKCDLSPRWPKHPGLRAVELKSYGPAYSSIIVSDKLKVIYVPVFKVATTSMMWHIAYLENNSFILNQDLSKPGSRDYFLHEMGSPGWRNHSIYSRSAYELRNKFEDPSYLKFGFVRNPFHRVISAYMDKIINHGIDSIEYQTQMYSLYGEDSPLRSLRNKTKPTFKEFLQAVRQVLKEPRVQNSDLTAAGSFEDNKSRRDLHWRPQVELLHPDLIHFDFVGRFENIEEDRQIVLDWIYRHTSRRMPAYHHEKMHSTDPKGKAKLYKFLRDDPEIKDLILEIYDQDFRYFRFPTAIPEMKT